MIKYFFTLIILSFFVLISNAQSSDKTTSAKKENSKKPETQQNSKKTSETEELKWYNWNEGYPLAVKKNKILIIDIYTDWCGWCKKMDRDTYAKSSVIDMINKDFIVVKFNPEIKFDGYEIEGVRYNNSQLFSMLCNNQRVGYPTTVFLYTSNKKIYYFSGYQDEANFKKTLQYYLTLRDK